MPTVEASVTWAEFLESERRMKAEMDANPKLKAWYREHVIMPFVNAIEADVMAEVARLAQGEGGK